MSLTIDEAIARFEQNAEQNERWANGGLNPEANAEYAAEHRQLAAWLRELQERRKQPEKAQLSQEGTTSDTISRQAAIDIFDDYNIAVENGELEAYSRDRKRLCDLPTVQPEPQEGHWIWAVGDLECSKCHTRYPDLYPDYDNSVACPHCGAHMKGATT